MAKHGRKKTATFTLEPDGFSIHTFEVSRQIEGKRYHKIKDFLYSLNEEYGKIVTYPESKRIIKCTAFRAHGINIALENNAGKDGSYQAMTLRIFISPRRLLDPGTSYLGIFPPRKESIDDVFEAFDDLFANTPLPADLNDYILTRADLCTNIRCDKTKLFRELVRVIHKLPTPPKYERKLHKTSTKGMSKSKRAEANKADNRYNKHYLKVSCDSVDLVIYDKTYQMSAEELTEVSYEDYDAGVLRFECRLMRDPLRKVMEKYECKTTRELLKHLIVHSEEIMLDYFSRCFAEDDFCRLDEIESVIEASGYHKKTREAMLELSHRLSRGKIVDKVFERMELDGWKFDRKDILDRFAKLGINPIPLWKSFCAERLPSPVTLLKGISEGEIKVKYLLIK